MFFHRELPWNIWVSLVLELATYLFITLILPAFFFETDSCTKNIEHDWKKLNMSDNNGKVTLAMKMTFKL